MRSYKYNQRCKHFHTFCHHYENTPIQIYWKFHHQNWKFSDKNCDIFHITAENIDCGYSLEPPRLAEAVLTGTHNLCFQQKQEKIMYTL